MRIKICGITKLEQGQKIGELGATALGFICVERSPRYVTPEQIKTIITNLSTKIDTIGVFADEKLSNIVKIVRETGLSGVQLHGSESPEFCLKLKQQLPSNIEMIKAFSIQSSQSLQKTTIYNHCVNTLLLDAYHPQMLGGTGKTLNWKDLQQFSPALPWMLAGGLNPDNISDALAQVQPDGIDLSSGVEKSPGDKDLNQVARLFNNMSLGQVG